MAWRMTMWGSLRCPCPVGNRFGTKRSIRMNMCKRSMSFVSVSVFHVRLITLDITYRICSHTHLMPRINHPAPQASEYNRPTSSSHIEQGFKIGIGACPREIPGLARNLQLPTLVLSCHMQSYYPSHLCISLLQIKAIYFSLVSASSHCVIFISTVELSIVSANTGLQRCKKKDDKSGLEEKFCKITNMIAFSALE